MVNNKSNKFQDLIDACNYCILTCRSNIEKCKTCKINRAAYGVQAKECGVECQKTIQACYDCIHECNQILESSTYDNNKQKDMLIELIKVCRETISRCENTINKVVDQKNEDACAWSLENLTKCIQACDLCIETFNGR